MKLPIFKTKNLLIGNLLYFENNTFTVSNNRYLAVKSKKNDRYNILSDDINLPDNLSVLLGLDTSIDDISIDKYYLINTYSLKDKIKVKKLSLEEVINIAIDVDNNNFNY